MSLGNLKSKLEGKVQNLQTVQNGALSVDRAPIVMMNPVGDGSIGDDSAVGVDSNSSVNHAAAASSVTEANVINSVNPSNSVNPIALVNSDYLVLRSNALDIIRENLKNHQLSRASIDTVKSPSGGSIVFTIPGISGDEIHKELIGIILDYTTPRAYWESTDPVEGTPPDCYSLDSLISHDGKPCALCEYNEFGSKDNGDSPGKACKESIEIYLLRQDTIMPIIVRVPVSSKAIFQRYMTRLVGHMLPACGVVTKITLEKATSKAGQPYAKFIFEAVKTLTAEETVGIRNFSQNIMEVLTAAALEQKAKETVLTA